MILEGDDALAQRVVTHFRSAGWSPVIARDATRALPAARDDERQTDLSHSFCQWVVSGDEPMRIDDARDHPVLRHNLAVRDISVTAYLGVPLRVTGKPVGSFCAINSVPQNWTEADLQLLRNLGCVVETFGLPPRATGHDSLEVIVSAADALRYILNDSAVRLEPDERDLLWQIVTGLGKQLAEIRPL